MNAFKKFTCSFLCFLFVILSAFSSAMADTIFDCYQKAMLITPASGKVTSTLSNFPILVRLSASRQIGFDPADCGENGADLRFVLSDGTLLAHEIDLWNPEGESLVWVCVPSLTASTEMYALFSLKEGVAAPPVRPKGEVWPNFVAVYHFSEEGNIAYDSSVNAYDATNDAPVSASTTIAVGRSAFATSTFTSGVTNLLSDTAAHKLANRTQLTLSGWLRTTQVAANGQYIFGDATWQNNRGGAGIFVSNGANKGLYVLAAGGSENEEAVGKTFTLPNSGNWSTLHHFTVAYNGTTASVWIDGVKLSNQALKHAVLVPSAGKFGEALYIGNHYWTNGATYDEMRYRDGVVSDAWAKADYQNQKSADFLSYGVVYNNIISFSVEDLMIKSANENKPKFSLVNTLGSSFTPVEGVDYTVEFFDNTADSHQGRIVVTGKEGGSMEGIVIEKTFNISRYFYVTSYALENEGDGLSWASPMSLTNAVVKSISGDVIVLKAGEYQIEKQLVISKALTIRGGYAGTDIDALDPDRPLSVLTQGAAIDILVSVTASSGSVVMERIQVEKARQYGMQKNNAAGSLYVYGCNFVSNGFSTASSQSAIQDGKGLRILGSTAAHIVVSNCLFAYNCQTNNTAKTGAPGAALYIAAARSAHVVDSRFFGNCLFMGHVTGSSGAAIGDKFPLGAAIYATSPVHLLRCDFRANVGQQRWNVNAGGILYFASGSLGSSISNCIFAANLSRANGGTTSSERQDTSQYGGTVVLNLDAASQAIDIYGSTFAYNLTDSGVGGGAINVLVGTANIKNCVFGGNHIRRGALHNASDIKVAANGVVNISYSVLGADIDNSVYSLGAYNEGPGLVYSDPLLVSRPENITNMIYRWKKANDSYWETFRVDGSVTGQAIYDKISAIDVHLLSTQGYVTDADTSLWHVADVASPAIDNGDPLDDYSLEQYPNGSRRNAGAYGNTSQASKTKMSTIPLGFENVEIDYPNGYSNPRIRFSVTGDAGCFVETFIAGTVAGGNSFNVTMPGCTPGVVYEYYLPDYYVRGTEISFTISGISTGGAVAPMSSVFNVEADRPKWWGHGGGETVLHVWSGALGDGSGKDWQNACRSWNDMVAAYNARETKPEEIWFVDIERPDRNSDTLKVTSDLVMRGGFDYYCDSIADRKDGAISILSSERMFSLASVSNGSGVEVIVERLEFTRSTVQGFYKKGAGDLVIRDCKFTMNAYDKQDINGRGLCVEGSASSTRVSVSNCIFAANGMYSQVGYVCGYGAGAYFSNIARVSLDNCLFVTNGAMRSGTYPTPNNGGDKTQGSAIYLSNAPLTARNCSFLSNHGVTRDNTYSCGGAIRFVGNCDGSAMTNCIVSGCSDRRGWGFDNGRPGYHGGAITVTMDSSAYTIDLVNVTIAYNLSDGIACPGGINIFTGTVNLKNSIVFGNFCSHNALAGNRFGGDIDVKEGGVLNAEYTLFSEDSTNSISYAEGATVNLGQGVIYGDPLFATSFATVRSRVAYPFGSNYTYFDTTAANVGKLAEFNLHLRGGRGYYDEKTGELVKDYATEINSLAIDAGDRSSSYANEVDTMDGWHGRRVNLGAYGNTPWATMTAYPGSVITIR